MTYELTPSDIDALSDYGALPNPIEGFTTQEILDELVKRGGVKKIVLHRGQQSTTYGAATILVVRGK